MSRVQSGTFVLAADTPHACAKCQQPFKGWIMFPPKQIIYCKACVTWDEAVYELRKALGEVE